LQVCFTMATLAIVPAALVQIAAPWLTLLPYGAQYQGGEPVVLWVMVATVSYALLWPMGNILISMGRIWFALIVGTVHNVLSLALCWWLVPRFGAAGLALATSVSFVIASSPCVVLLQRSLPDLLRQVRWYRMSVILVSLLVVCGTAARMLMPTPSLMVGILAALLFVCWRAHPATNRPLAVP